MVQIVKQSFQIYPHLPAGYNSIEKFIEEIARTCYKSEDKIKEDSAEKFIKNILIARDHTAMLEHGIISVRIITDRAIANELIRHRIASFAQESTRFCAYNKEKFGSEITVICPQFATTNQSVFNLWYDTIVQIECTYMSMIASGVKAEVARDILPLCLKTEIVITANLREWKKIFELRTSSAAHPLMRELMTEIEKEFIILSPCIFEKQ